MISFFETTSYLIGLISVAATFFCYGKQTTFTRNNQRLQTSCAYGCWDLNKRIHFRKLLTFVGLWTVLIGFGIVKI